MSMENTYGHQTKPVVVGIDGGENGDRALRFAIDEAGRRSTGIRLVHVYATVLPIAPMSPMYQSPNPHEIGSQVLKDALDRCLELAPDLFVEGTLAHGNRAEAIVKESSDAACIVLGTRAWNLLRTVGGSTSAGVATRATCPVLMVPPGWDEHSNGRVTVGVDESGDPIEAVEIAFEAAQKRGADVVVLHGWAPRHLYGPDFHSWKADEWSEATRAVMAERVATVRRRFPDVQTSYVASLSEPADALAEHASTSDLLVLGRHQGKAHTHRLGSLAHRAIQAGLCPVVIAPLRTQADSQ